MKISNPQITVELTHKELRTIYIILRSLSIDYCDKNGIDNYIQDNLFEELGNYFCEHE